ncbi:MAG: hypothetical protein JNM43_02570 [Planctomycetaceae bacterium]|nr:hypothetical protein [Planctomycetaceae bacterium]
MTRLNFTGRRRISHQHVTITVSGIGGIESFRAELQLESYQFPSSAAVIIEAWRQLELARFEFGTIGNLQPPADCRLSEFGAIDGLKFRVKVVSMEPPRGRLLAVADRIAPQAPGQQAMPRVPLLAVRSQDLGREIWRLDFSDEPLLLVNPRVVSRKQLVQATEFQSLVLPEILRSILTRILLVEQTRSTDDAEDWTARWLRFAESLPGVGRVPEDSDPESDLDWIDSAISSFCRWRGVDKQFTGFWSVRQNTGDAQAEQG